MFGLQFIKVQPTDYVLLYKDGKVVREGAGLAFFYFAPNSSIVRIPMASVDAPFIFNEVSSDFQEVSVQGQITYRISDPRKLSQQLDFSLAPNGRFYASDDPTKLSQRLINHTQVLTRSFLKSMPLREALISSDAVVEQLKEGLKKSEIVSSLGLEILGLSILAIRPTPETSRALEAEAREQILRKADEAIYTRRNAAVEQERAIRENELNTEIAVENKKRQIREAQMDAEKSVQQKNREIREAEMATQIVLEQQKQDLISLSTQNARQEADAKAYSVATVMQAFSQVDVRVLQALASINMGPEELIATAFKGLAENADKIGQLNISPDLLRELMSKQKEQ